MFLLIVREREGRERDREKEINERETLIHCLLHVLYWGSSNLSQNLQIFSPSLWCVFSFEDQKCFILIIFIFFILSENMLLMSYLKKSLTEAHKSLLLCFILQVYRFRVYI